ncbi:hypothetical protein QYE76_018617 [Lolium multiflorum]|uniref:Reverse transcriptase domain-containing protein n=1 Tax=Lolium multiflorum TaxID=4521 RepID=A0AAD8QIE9_LOLMU|nr:hypothetical protein QYE76_018617 [Lolium multiflorum]
MSITLGEATKLLDNMMINYSEWHTERAPQGKKVNSVEESSSLSDKIDAIMSMLVNDRTNIDPNNVPLASLVAQEEHVDVNFIKNNNFNNNAYGNNSSNNYRPYPYNNGNGYGNSYGNSYNNNRNSPLDLKLCLKNLLVHKAFNKSVEEKLHKIDILVSRVDSLASDVDLLKSKVMPNRDIENKITTTANAIQVRINENIRLMAELRARWDREENEKLAKEKNIAKVWTITTTSNANATHVAAPPTHTNKRIGVSNVSTSNAKREKLPETAKTAETACDKAAEIFSNIGDDDPIALDYNGLNFDDCHISEVIKFLQKLAKSPNASAINLAFTHHITNALIKAREEKLEREASIPKKLEDGWEPIIKMKVKDFDCNALCDLGASISVMPKKIYNMLDLPPLKNCYLDVNLADHSTKKPLGKVDNVRITVNNNLVPVDFVVLDIECNASCPIILGRPFLRTVGAIIDMGKRASPSRYDRGIGQVYRLAPPRVTTREHCGPSLGGSQPAALGSSRLYRVVVAARRWVWRSTRAAPGGTAFNIHHIAIYIRDGGKPSVKYEDLPDDLKKKYDEIKAVPEAELIGSLHRTLSWRRGGRVSHEGALDGWTSPPRQKNAPGRLSGCCRSSRRSMARSRQPSGRAHRLLEDRRAISSSIETQSRVAGVNMVDLSHSIGQPKSSFGVNMAELASRHGKDEAKAATPVAAMKEADPCGQSPKMMTAVRRGSE